MIDATGTTTYAYDALARMTGKTDPGGLTQAYAYDVASQRIKLVDPDGGVRTYAYDADGHTVVFQDPTGSLTTLQYDADGQKTTVIFGEGPRRLFVYDAAGQTTRIVEQKSAGTELASSTYTYDANGNRTGILWGTGMRTTYQYDGRDRLTEDATSGLNTHTYDYSYDGVDNRLTCTETGNLATSTIDAAQRPVTSVEAGVGTTTFTYDPNGNLTNVVSPDGSLITMSYDKENRLKVHQSGASVATYGYDGGGLKRLELVDGVATTLLWDSIDYLGEV